MLTIRESFSLYLSPSLASKRERRGSKSERGSEGWRERRIRKPAQAERSGSLSFSPVLPSSASLLEMCCLRLAKREREKSVEADELKSHPDPDSHDHYDRCSLRCFISLTRFIPSSSAGERKRESEASDVRHKAARLASRVTHTHTYMHTAFEYA